VKPLVKVTVLTLYMCLFVLFSHSNLFADDSLKAPLIDLPGWQGEEAQAMSMDMNGVKMTNSMRAYEKGDSSIAATIMITSQQMGMMSFQQMSMSQGSIKVESKEMDGFKILLSHDSSENSGNFMVMLGETKVNSALFSLGYEGVSEKEIMSIAKKYDWKAMQNAAKKLMK